MRVVYSNNRYDVVNDSLMQELIEKNLIKKFLRSDGWVTVGVDPTRRMTHPLNYHGSERRRTNTSVHLPLNLLSTPFSPPNT